MIRHLSTIPIGLIVACVGAGLFMLAMVGVGILAVCGVVGR